MKKYIIEIPAQTIEIEALTETDAIEEMIDREMISYDIFEAKERYTMPIQGCSARYYIDRMFEHTDGEAWFCHSFLKDGDKLLFLDGRRMYSVPSDEIREDYYKDITKEYMSRIEPIKEYMEPYSNDATCIQIDLQNLLNKVADAIAHKDSHPRYVIKVNDVIHIINPYFLLDALSFAETTDVCIGPKSEDRFLMAGSKGKAAMVLPLIYNKDEDKNLVVDMEI